MDAASKSASAAIISGAKVGGTWLLDHPVLSLAAAAVAAGTGGLIRLRRPMALEQIEQLAEECWRIAAAGAKGSALGVLDSLADGVLASHPGDDRLRIEAAKALDDSKSLTAVLSRGWLSSIDGRLFPIGDPARGEGSSVAGCAFVERRLQYVGNGRKSERFHSFKDHADHRCGESVSVASMYVCLPGSSEPCGTLSIASTRKRFFNERDLHLLVIAAFALGEAWSLAA